LSKQKVKEALRVFRLNTILYPASANVYDSYGEVLLAGGQKKLAIENYRKSLELDSANQSAREALEKLVPLKQ
jgi:predicted negative regulator of RcsB-dependent stress response